MIHPEHHSLAMRLKHFKKLKEKTNQEIRIILTRYNLASIVYRLHMDFKYMISNNTIKAKKPNIKFYYEAIIKKSSPIYPASNYLRVCSHIKTFQSKPKRWKPVKEKLQVFYSRNSDLLRTLTRNNKTLTSYTKYKQNLHHLRTPWWKKSTRFANISIPFLRSYSVFMLQFVITALICNTCPICNSCLIL